MAVLRGYVIFLSQFAWDIFGGYNSPLPSTIYGGEGLHHTCEGEIVVFVQ
jgi:hypothetical protein